MDIGIGGNSSIMNQMKNNNSNWDKKTDVSYSEQDMLGSLGDDINW